MKSIIRSRSEVQHASIVADYGDANGCLLMNVLVGNFRNRYVETAAAFFHQAFHYLPLVL